MALTEKQRGNMLQALGDLRADLGGKPAMSRHDLWAAELIIAAQDGSSSQEIADETLDLIQLVGRSLPVVPIEGSNNLTGVATWLEDSPALTATLTVTRSSLKAPEWIERLRAITSCVCRITFNHVSGTGFLVAPDLVLTNHHVMDVVISRHVDPRAVELHLEPVWSRNGSRGVGAVHHLARKDWLVAASPLSRADAIRLPKPFEATIGELDYALLRLDDAPGRERGFIPIPVDVRASPGDALHIVQYPGVIDLMVGIQGDSVQTVNKSKTRLTYLTNAGAGSSGAPCFDKDWNLVAIHHSGDPSFDAAYNEGIPAATIRRNLPAHALKALPR